MGFVDVYKIGSMNVYEMQLFQILKLRLGEKEAEGLVGSVKSKVKLN